MSNVLMYCPSCGQHFEVMPALGQWIATHCDDAYVLWCDFDEDHDRSTVMNGVQHGLKAGWRETPHP